MQTSVILINELPKHQTGVIPWPHPLI